MENRFRERGVNDERRFFDQIESGGFTLEGTRTEGAWNIYQFSIGISYTVPEIKDKFKENGRPNERNLVLWTRPYSIGLEFNGFFTSGGQREDRERFYSSTEGPVSEPDILEFIAGYLETTREGKAYRPSR